MTTLTHYGWDCSPYSAKTRSYLTWAGIDFDDVHPQAWGLFRTVKSAVGRPIMPTVRFADGHWQQDSSAIIDEVEATRDGPSIHPVGPRQRLTSYLFELHADEWMPTVHMHTRWNRPGNAEFALSEFAREGFPWMPAGLAKALIRPVRDKMAGYRPLLGISTDTTPGIERFAHDLLERLNDHFTEHPYLLGTRPCLGDFSLFGPLWAHLYRDPASTELFRNHTATVAWMERLLAPPGEPGDFLADDAIPATLEPILRTLFEEQMTWCRTLVQAINAWCAANPGATRVPRSLGDAPFVVGGAEGSRRLITATQWKLQRVLDAHAALSEADAATAEAWLDSLGGSLPRVAHPFVRDGFKMVLAAPA